MSIAEIGAALQAVVDAVTEQRKGLVHVADSLQQARDRFHAVTATSGHHLVGETLRQQTQAIDRLREAETLLSAVPAALAEFATAIGATVRLVGQHRPTVPSSYGDSPRHITVTSEPPVPAAVVRLAGWLTPWREGEDVRGYAFDSDRRHLNDELFSSGRLRPPPTVCARYAAVVIPSQSPTMLRVMSPRAYGQKTVPEMSLW